jgi:hypothetical protein
MKIMSKEKSKFKIYVVTDTYEIGIAKLCCCERCKDRGFPEILINSLRTETETGQILFSLTLQEFFEGQGVKYKAFTLEEISDFFKREMSDREKNDVLKDMFIEEYRTHMI